MFPCIGMQLTFIMEMTHTSPVTRFKYNWMHITIYALTFADQQSSAKVLQTFSSVWHESAFVRQLHHNNAQMVVIR